MSITPSPSLLHEHSVSARSRCRSSQHGPQRKPPTTGSVDGGIQLLRIGCPTCSGCVVAKKNSSKCKYLVSEPLTIELTGGSSGKCRFLFSFLACSICFSLHSAACFWYFTHCVRQKGDLRELTNETCTSPNAYLQNSRRTRRINSCSSGSSLPSKITWPKRLRRCAQHGMSTRFLYPFSSLSGSVQGKGG